jgi:hypothetical protein
MRFGIAGFLPGSEKRIGMAKKLGYEFIESSLSALHDDFSQESIDAMAEQIKSIGMPCVAVNGMFPKRIALLGKSADKGEIRLYYDIYGTKEKLAQVKAGESVTSRGGYIESGKEVYIIIEATDAGGKVTVELNNED